MIWRSAYVVRKPAFCLSYTLSKQKSLWIFLFFLDSLPTCIHSPLLLCVLLNLPSATLRLISTCWNFKWLPTRQKEIRFLCTASLHTDGPITLAYNKSQQGVHCLAVILGLCASGGWEGSWGAAPLSCNEAIAHFADSSSASVEAAVSEEGEGRKGQHHVSCDLVWASCFTSLYTLSSTGLRTTGNS